MITDPQLQRLARQLTPIIESLRPAPVFIGARYTSNAGTNIANATETIVNFEDVDYDPLSLVTTGASWVFACPVAGYYQVQVFIRFQSSTDWAPGEVLELNLFRDGTEVAMLLRLDDWPASSTLVAAGGGGDTLYCDAGDTLQVRVYQASGVNLNLSSDGRYNHISIYRVG